MTTDTQIEAEIQAKGKTAPRVTSADIEANIASEHYFTAMDGAEQGFPNVLQDPSDPLPAALNLLTFCVLVLRNGFTVVGESACASPENFDAEIGRKIARENAVQKVWPLLGFALKTELSRPVLTEADALADLAGTPRPDNPTTQPAYRLKFDRFDHKAGTIVYDQKYHDYGLASEDTRHTGLEHVSVSLKPDGGYPGFTVPKHQLERIPTPPAADFLANSKACDLSGDAGCEACQ